MQPCLRLIVLPKVSYSATTTSTSTYPYFRTLCPRKPAHDPFFKLDAAPAAVFFLSQIPPLGLKCFLFVGGLLLHMVATCSHLFDQLSCQEDVMQRFLKLSIVSYNTYNSDRKPARVPKMTRSRFSAPDFLAITAHTCAPAVNCRTGSLL